MIDAHDARAPLADVPARDVVRDVVAATALLVALPMPWDVLRRGSDLWWVVIPTLLALVALTAPYAARAGALPGFMAQVAQPRGRLVVLAPYGLVALGYLVTDVVRASAGVGMVGAGLAVGLAGAILAVATPAVRGTQVAAAVVAVAAVVTPLVSLVDAAGWAVTVGGVLAALLVVGILRLTAWDAIKGDLAAGIVLVAIGAWIALSLVLLGGGSLNPWFESLHSERYGVLLLPAVAAFAVPRVAQQWEAVGADGPGRAALWAAVAVRAFDLMVLVGGFVALVAVLRLVAGTFQVEPVLRLVVGLVVVVVAFLARRALARDLSSGHATAVGAAVVVVGLGLVIVVARTGVLTASRVEELLLTVGLPAVVLAVLLLPPAVRELVAASADSPPTTSDPSGGQPAVVVGDQVASHHPEPGPAAAEPGGWDDRPAPDDAAPAEAAPAGPAAAGPSPSSRWRTTWAEGTDATQQMSPVSQPVDATAVRPHDPGVAETQVTGQPVAAPQEAPRSTARSYDAGTQVLPPVPGTPSSRWTPEQAIDPMTPLADLAAIVTEAPHLRPHVAANPATYPALLDWLGALGDPAVDAALRTRR